MLPNTINHEKGSDGIGSAVCVQRDIYIVYTVSQIADPISSEPISRHTLYLVYNCTGSFLQCLYRQRYSHTEIEYTHLCLKYMFFVKWYIKFYFKYEFWKKKKNKKKQLIVNQFLLLYTSAARKSWTSEIGRDFSSGP